MELSVIATNTPANDIEIINFRAVSFASLIYASSSPQAAAFSNFRQLPKFWI